MNEVKANNGISAEEVLDEMSDLVFGIVFELPGQRRVCNRNGDEELFQKIPAAYFLKGMLCFQVEEEDVFRFLGIGDQGGQMRFPLKITWVIFHQKWQFLFEPWSTLLQWQPQSRRTYPWKALVK